MGRLKSKAIGIVLLLAFFLVGCSGGGYRTVMSSENSTNNRTEMTYSSFKGSKFTSLKLKQGDILDLDVEVVTREGNLTISLIDEGNKELVKIENPKEPVKKNIKVDKDGTYKIKVEGNHKGSYKINWNVKADD